jgi:hypothetical protein
MQAPATHALLQKVDRVLAALITQDGTTNGTATIQVGTKYWAGSMNKFFPTKTYPNEWRQAKVTFTGIHMEAPLDDMLGMTERRYAGDLPSSVDAAKIAEIKKGPWELTGLEVERKGTNDSDPLWRHLYFKCADVDFKMSHELSTVERISPFG